MRHHRVLEGWRGRWVLLLALAHWACGAGRVQELPRGYYILAGNSYEYFYLGGPHHSADGVGMLEGSAERIGWNNEYLIAWRVPTVATDGTGWMVVRMEDGRIQGPYDDAGLAALVQSEPKLRGIAVRKTRELFGP